MRKYNLVWMKEVGVLYLEVEVEFSDEEWLIEFVLSLDEMFRKFGYRVLVM